MSSASSSSTSSSTSAGGVKSSASPYGLQFTNRYFMKIKCLDNPGRAGQIVDEILRVNGVEQVTVDLVGNVVGVIISTLVSVQYQREVIERWLQEAAQKIGVEAVFFT